MSGGKPPHSRASALSGVRELAPTVRLGSFQRPWPLRRTESKLPFYERRQAAGLQSECAVWSAGACSRCGALALSNGLGRYAVPRASSRSMSGGKPPHSRASASSGVRELAPARQKSSMTRTRSVLNE